MKPPPVTEFMGAEGDHIGGVMVLEAAPEEAVSAVFAEEEEGQ